MRVSSKRLTSLPRRFVKCWEHMADEREPGDRPTQAATAPAEPARESGVRGRAAGFVGRHPSLLKVLEWLGVYNPGGGINP
jgi:hypothetical protein